MPKDCICINLFNCRSAVQLLIAGPQKATSGDSTQCSGKTKNDHCHATSSNDTSEKTISEGARQVEKVGSVLPIERTREDMIAERVEINRCEWQTVSRVLDRTFFILYGVCSMAVTIGFIIEMYMQLDKNEMWSPIAEALASNKEGKFMNSILFHIIQLIQ